MELGRPEILNRIGENIVVFDFIRESVAGEILDSQINRIINNLKMDKGIKLEIPLTESVTDEMKALYNTAKISCDSRRPDSRKQGNCQGTATPAGNKTKRTGNKRSKRNGFGRISD